MLLNKKGYVIALVMVCFAFGTLVAIDDFARAEQQKVKVTQEPVKTITLKKEPQGISPNPLTVKLGTTLVWFNGDPEPVTIKFIQKLGIACKAPVNFYGDLFGYYETGPVPQGATASICFIYQGDYEYEVKRLVDKGTQKQVEEISHGMISAIE